VGGAGQAEDTPTLPIPDVEGVDKQAMVQDWLNPDNNTTTAPLVQFHQDNLAIQKFSKVCSTGIVLRSRSHKESYNKISNSS
jgi:hypothetical protein